MNEKREHGDTQGSDHESEAAIRMDEDSGTKDAPSQDMTFEDMTRPELIEQVRTFRESSEKNYDLFLRSQAEIENLKKRNKRESEDLIKYSNENLIKQILPAIDHLEMAISHSNDKNALDALREGVELTLKGLRDTLMKAGLVEVKATGEIFDPCFHEAVSEMEDRKVATGTVLAELQKGYTLNRRLIRPARVVVSRVGNSRGFPQVETPESACDNR